MAEKSKEADKTKKQEEAKDGEAKTTAEPQGKEEDKKIIKIQKPCVGRIVHFAIEKDEILPAIIVGVNDDETVNLRVFTNGEFAQAAMLLRNVKEGTKEKQWSWPPRDGE